LNGGPTPVITSPHVVWDSLSVEAGGVLTLTFRAQVPTQIRIDPNNTARDYRNSLSASAPGLVICDMRDKEPSKAIVTRQIGMDKSVNPNHTLSGGTVIYTITLQNYGHNTISSIRLTDTLPSAGGADFHYDRMLQGPYPVAVHSNAVVWDGLNVPGDGATQISFYAQANGWPLVEYGNAMYAYSPQTTIPARTDRAKVKIDSPLTIDKNVSPGETFVEMEDMGQPLPQYTVRVCNVASGAYTISQFRDQLPSGFYGVDGTSYENPYVYDLPAPITLYNVGECWEHTFPVAVTKDVGCGNLPQTYRNLKGNACVRVTAPVDQWFCNAADVAPLKVNPHVSVVKEQEYRVVIPGETFLYTITLNNTSPIAVHLVSVMDDLPGPFEYVEMVTGATPVLTDPIRWENLTVPAGSQVVLAFRVYTPEDAPLNIDYRNDAVATPETLALVCVEDMKPMAEVKVVEAIAEFTKVADPAAVPVRGVVLYTIRLRNLDFKPITGVVVTETMPNLLGKYFEYIDIRPGTPAPDEVREHQVIWRNLTLPVNTTLELKFDARASILLGVHNNDVTAWCPRTQEILPKRVSGVNMTLAPVNVLPGIVLYKTVFPTATVAGQNVIYTITLANLSDKDLTNVRITDTLPSGFSFRQRVEGPVPSQRSPQVVWDLGTVQKNTVRRVVFQANVGMRVISGTHYNTVVGSSPAAQIPGAENTAPLHVTGIDIALVYLPLLLRNR
jgi:uncharacterized repeat protein (TIGR01451 family)